MTPIHVYGTIGEAENTPTLLANKLKGAGDVGVEINSPGGSAFDGVAMHSQLIQHRARYKVAVTVQGLAASAASLVAMAGSTIDMADGSMLMIHSSAGLTLGNSGEHKRTSETLEKLDGSMANIYAHRTGKPAAEVRRLMDNETWMDAEQAVAEGFADRVVRGVRAVACAIPDQLLKNYKNPGRYTNSAASKANTMNEHDIAGRMTMLRRQGHDYGTLPAAYTATFGGDLRADLGAAFNSLSDKEQSRRWPGGPRQYVENQLTTLGR